MFNLWQISYASRASQQRYEKGTKQGGNNDNLMKYV